MLIPNKFNGYTRDGIRRYNIIDLGGDAPAPDPLIGEAAKMNAELAKESLAFYKDVYVDELIPMQRENQQLAKTLIDKYMSTMDKQSEFADKQNQYYESTFKPVEEKMAKEAMEYDSDANVNRRMGIASANVNQQFSNAREQNTRSLSRFGLNPNSSAFAATNERLTRAQALASAGSQTGAAFDTQDRAIALRSGVANFGRNMPNTAANYYSNSNASGGAAMGTSTQAMNNVSNNAGIMGQGFSSAGGLNQSAAGIAQSDYNARLSAYNSQQDALGGLIGMGVKAGIGYATGGMGGMGNMMAGAKLFADGGPVFDDTGAVNGLGGPRDDMIDAKLSDGEFVLNEGAVKHFGLAKLNKMNEVGLKNQQSRGLLRG
jgi:hypothetical protein